MTHAKRRATAHAVSILCCLLVGTSCVANRPRLNPAPPSDSVVRLDPAPPSGPVIRIEFGPGGAVVSLDLEDYVAGSILAEADVRGLDINAATRVAQVQAILARTYALANRTRHAHEGFDLCSTTHCQVYRPADRLSKDSANLARSAARATSGLVITHNNSPINALFHADCGGNTSDATVAWGGPTPPYLQAVNDPFCLLNSPPFWRFTIDRSALLSALNLDPTTQIGTHLDSLQTTKKDQAGRVVNVVIRGQKSVATVRGEKLRQVLTRRFGPKSIRSAKFSVERRGDQFVFEGQGWGHGIGLCQRGASARANAGHTTAAIFHHYYPGTSLTQYY